MKGKTSIIAKFHRTDLVTCSHSREGKTLSRSQIPVNTVTKILVKGASVLVHLIQLCFFSVLQIRRGKRDNLGIIFPIAPLK